MKRILLLAAVLFAVVSANAQFINTPSSQSQPKAQTKSSSSSDVTFRGEFNVGMTIGQTKFDGEKIDGTMVTPVLTGTFGVKLNDYLFFGAGTGFKYITQDGNEGDGYDKMNYTINSLMLPVFVEVKAFIPVSYAAALFLMADFGYGMRLDGEFRADMDYYGKANFDTKDGLCYKFGAGVNIDNFIIALGYDCQKFGVEKLNGDFTSSGFFFSLGFVL